MKMRCPDIDGVLGEDHKARSSLVEVGAPGKAATWLRPQHQVNALNGAWPYIQVA